MVDEPEEPARDSSSDELLQQWERRIGEDGNPVEALAELLGERQAARGRLFGRAGDVVLGCRLIRILGAGGMGVTYEAEGPDGAMVAVKLVPGVTNGVRDRFEQECRLLRALSHPAIVRYAAHAVLPDGTGVLVMDRVVGIELELLLVTVAGGGPEESGIAAADQLLCGIEARGEALWLSPRYRRRMLRLLAEVADGLHAAHECGIVHRDVKPANVLVRDDLSPVVIDFGLARDVLGRVSFTQSGAAMGTLAYMAPEQCGRDPGAVDRRTDVYSLGLVLYRVLQGVDLRQEIGHVVRSGSRAFLLDARLSRALPVDLQAILYHCLDPRPGYRYATAAELADDLRAAAGQGRVTARRPGAVRRFLRDRTKVAVAAAVLMTVLLASIWAAWPRGRRVLFAANCAASEAIVRIERASPARLGNAVWLPYGTHRASLVGEAVREADVDFEVVPGEGVQRIGIRTFHLAPTRPALLQPDPTKPSHSPLLFITGHSLQEFRPGLRRDRRFINGEELQGPWPIDAETILPRGRHELSAIDGLGREERQTVELGAQPEDVQLLPAVMAAIEGSYRRTWSTVLSPRPADLELVTDAQTWLGPPAPPVFGHGMSVAPCALTPGTADCVVTVRLRCHFPEPMRSAVVHLRGTVEPGALLDVTGGFDGERAQEWPQLATGRLEPMQQFSCARGGLWLEINARLRADDEPNASLALVRLFDGLLFGGHLIDEPPCFAVVADPTDRAVLAPTLRGTAPSAAPRLDDTRVWNLPWAPGASHGVRFLQALPGPDGAFDLLVTDAGADRQPAVWRLSWPARQVKAVWTASTLHARRAATDGRSFGQALAAGPDLDGDGWADVAIGDSSSERLLVATAGSVGLVASRDGAVRWLWPDQISSSQHGDDNAGHVLPAGDWNGDGLPDVVVGADSAASNSGLSKAGVVAVLDGRTGAPLWRREGSREKATCMPLDTWAGAALGGPRAVLLREQLKAKDGDEPRANALSVWLGGASGRLVRPILLPRATAAVLVGDAATTGEPALVVLRTGPWPDGFVGLERFDVDGADWRLAARQPLALPLADVGAVSGFHVGYLVRTEDLDGDGVGDVACVLRPPQPEPGVLFVSGRDLSLIGFAPVVDDTIDADGGSPVWMPRQADEPAQLLVPVRRIVEGVDVSGLLGIVPRR